MTTKLTRRAALAAGAALLLAATTAPVLAKAERLRSFLTQVWNR